MKFHYATLTLGAHVIPASGDEVITVATPSDVIIHPDYRSPGLKLNDIAIVFIRDSEDQENIMYHPKISPICLPSPSFDQAHDGKFAVAVGWGKKALNGPTSPVLLEVDLTIVSLKECRDIWSASEYSRNFLSPTVICAGRKDRIGDTCKGW